MQKWPAAINPRPCGKKAKMLYRNAFKYGHVDEYV